MIICSLLTEVDVQNRDDREDGIPSGHGNPVICTNGKELNRRKSWDFEWNGKQPG